MSLLKPIVILKTGSTIPKLAARQGDFEAWVSDGLGVAKGQVRVIDARDGSTLPAYDEIAGAVVTGSHAMVTERAAWGERLAAWLREAVRAAPELPLLGICYGHQLLAHALGGEVADNPRGREFGTVPVTVTPAARDDPLLSAVGAGDASSFLAQVCHTQSVIEMPPGATLLASSARDAHQAVRFGPAAWGVQFHPEFNAEAVRTYLRTYAADLRAEGQDPAALLATVAETPVAHSLLRHFTMLCLQIRVDSRQPFYLH